MLLPGREAFFRQFIHDYETIRAAEGRISEDPADYRSLPYRDLSGRMSKDWQIRSASFAVFIRKILIPMQRREEQPLLILDLGAGNGWLSNQLAARGHRVAAVDLITNHFDGLGCFRYYEAEFTPAQAEFDHLPFPKQAADLVVFNASLHYSVGYLETLREALRVLRPGGRLVILDTPVYQHLESGLEMVRERELQFVRWYGLASNALHSENFLTYPRLKELSELLHVEWQIITPFYGWRWLIRPLVNRLAGRREPAKFHMIVARLSS